MAEPPVSSAGMSYQGQLLADAEFKRTPGLRPDKFVVRFPGRVTIDIAQPAFLGSFQEYRSMPDREPIKTWKKILLAPYGDLILKDETNGNGMRANRIYVAEDGYTVEENGKYTQITLEDFRRNFTQGFVYGNRNQVTKNDKDKWTKIEGTFYNDYSLRPSRYRWNLKQLIAECVNSLWSGIPGQSVQAVFHGFLERTAHRIFPDDVLWGGGTPARGALEKLISRYPITVVPDYDNVLHFWWRNETQYPDGLGAKWKNWIHKTTQGQQYIYGAPHICVTGARIKREVILMEWEYVIKDFETNQYEKQEEIFKKYKIDPIYAAKQALITKKSDQYKENNFGQKAANEQKISRIRSMFQDQAFKVLQIKDESDDRLLLPLSKLRDIFKELKVPGRQEKDWIISAFMYVPTQREMRAHKSPWVNRWYDQIVAEDINNIDLNQGIISFKFPVGIFLPLEKEDVAKSPIKEFEDIYAPFAENQLQAWRSKRLAKWKESEKQRYIRRRTWANEEIVKYNQELTKTISLIRAAAHAEKRYRDKLNRNWNSSLIDKIWRGIDNTIMRSRRYRKMIAEIAKLYPLLLKKQITYTKQLKKLKAILKKVQDQLEWINSKSTEAHYVAYLGPVIVHAAYEEHTNDYGSWYRYHVAAKGYEDTPPLLATSDELEAYYAIRRDDLDEIAEDAKVTEEELTEAYAKGWMYVPGANASRIANELIAASGVVNTEEVHLHSWHQIIPDGSITEVELKRDNGWLQTKVSYNTKTFYFKAKEGQQEAV
jgi:hypothetical protein